MALFLSLLSFGLAAAEIIAVRNAGPRQASTEPEGVDVVRELKEINDRLVKVQLTIERLDRPSQSRRS
jgi:hypothetical protein